MTVLVTTHYLDEAEHCDRLALMHAGRLVALGSVAELKEVFAGSAVLEVACPRYLEALSRCSRRQDWVLEASVFGTRLHLVVDDAEQARRRVRETLDAAGIAGRERRARSCPRSRTSSSTTSRARSDRRRERVVKKIWAVAIKELRQAARDPLSLTMLLGLPAATAAAVRLRPQLRRPPRRPGGAGPRHERGEPRADRRLRELDLLRPRRATCRRAPISTGSCERREAEASW